MQLSNQDFESACRLGGLELVSHLADAKQQEPAFLASGIDPAIEKNQAEILNWLFENGAPVPKELPLSLCFHVESIAVFEVLLKWGWDINSLSQSGSTILATTKVLSNDSLLKWLLDHGADPNLGPSIINTEESSLPNRNSGHVLNYAATVSSIESFDLLIERGAKLENSHPLISVASSRTDTDSLPMMSHLLDIGVNINGTDHLDGPYSLWQTALHWAVYSGATEKARFLLDHGADAQIKDRGGNTPLSAIRNLIHLDNYKGIRALFGMHEEEGAEKQLQD